MIIYDVRDSLDLALLPEMWRDLAVAVAGLIIANDWDRLGYDPVAPGLPFNFSMFHEIKSMTS